MIPRAHDHKGCIYCAMPIGKTDLDPTTVLTRMAEFMLHFRVLQLPTNNKLYARALVNDNRAEARETLVDEALKLEADYILWIDIDTLPPCDGLLKLFGRQADMVGGLVVTKSTVPQPLIIRREHKFHVTDWTPGDVVACDGMGFGFTLMRTEIFKKLEKPWFAEGYKALTPLDAYSCTEDLPLMYRAIDAGFKGYVDTSVICQHVDWKTGNKFSWEPEKNAPLTTYPDGKKYVFYTAEQQLAHQEARDSKEE